MSLWPISYRLFRIRQRSRPDRSFVVRLRNQFAQKEGLVTRAWFSWRAVIASGSLMCSLLGATAAYAYTSDTVLPDHPLYPLRQEIESIQFSFAASNPIAKDQVRLQYLQRREHELMLMKQRNQRVPLQHVRVLLKQTKHLIKDTSFEREAATSTDRILKDRPALFVATTSTIDHLDHIDEHEKMNPQLQHLNSLVHDQAEELEREVTSMVPTSTEDVD